MYMSRDVLFSFMKDISAELFDLAVEIEEQLYDHPDTTLMKSRLFCEQILKLVFEQEEIKEVYPYKHVERIHTLYREQMIEEDLYVKLEWIRKKGNRAAHEIHKQNLRTCLKHISFYMTLRFGICKFTLVMNLNHRHMMYPDRGQRQAI